MTSCDQRAWHLGAGRLQTGARLHPHLLTTTYEIVAANLLDGDRRRVSDRIPALCALYRPRLSARAGMTEAEVLRQRPSSACRQESPWRMSPRAFEKGETDGFHEGCSSTQKSKEILGASFPGHEWRRSEFHLRGSTTYHVRQGRPTRSLQRAMQYSIPRSPEFHSDDPRRSSHRFAKQSP